MGNLFNEFKGVHPQEWESRIKEELHIPDTGVFVRKSSDGIPVEPFYHGREDDSGKLADVLPGHFPFIRGYREAGLPWKIIEEIEVINSRDAGIQAGKTVAAGADVVAFMFSNHLERCPDIRHLFDRLDPGKTEIILDNCLYPYVLWTALKEKLIRNNADRGRVTGAIAFDPLGFLAQNGDYPSTEEDVLAWEEEILKESLQSFPGIRTLRVNGSLFREAGGSPVQEMAFALAMGKEYLDIFTDRGIRPEDILTHLDFGFSTGPDYFGEIAKLRAFRLIWTWVVQQYLPQNHPGIKTGLIARTASWNMTLFDPHVNILRTTTEAMSAILGGADAVSVRRFDAAVHAGSDFAARLARNLQLILKYESGSGKVSDPAAGSYYLDHLTKAMAEKAWALFQEVEKRGGFRNALKAGFVQDEIEAKSAVREQKLRSSEEVLIGINRYPLRGEKLPSKKELQQFEQEKDLAGRKIKPLKIKRFAEPFERLRFRTARAGKPPRVFVFGLGKPAVRVARESFATNFFGIAGFEIIDGHVLVSVEEGVRLVNEKKPDIVVVCTDDERIEEVTGEMTGQFTCPVILVIAGNPERKEDLQKKGVHYFIHRKSDILEILNRIMEQLKIT